MEILKDQLTFADSPPLLFVLTQIAKVSMPVYQKGIGVDNGQHGLLCMNSQLALAMGQLWLAEGLLTANKGIHCLDAAAGHIHPDQGEAAVVHFAEDQDRATTL